MVQDDGQDGRLWAREKSYTRNHGSVNPASLSSCDGTSSTRLAVEGPVRLIGISRFPPRPPPVFKTRFCQDEEASSTVTPHGHKGSHCCLAPIT